MPLPRSITCNLCGAQHLKTSFNIHYKACAKKHPEEFARLQKKVEKREAAKRKAAQKFTGGGVAVGTSETKENNALAPVPLTSMEEYLPEYADEELVRYTCKICDRKFLKDRLAKHEPICIKLSKKRKRKAYDGSHHRLQGTPFEEWENHRSQTPREVLEWKARGGRRWREEVRKFREIAGLKHVEPSIKTERSAINRKPLRVKKPAADAKGRQAKAGTRKVSGIAGNPRKASAGRKTGQTHGTGVAGSPTKPRRGSKTASGATGTGKAGARRDSRSKENRTAGVNRRAGVTKANADGFNSGGLKESIPNKSASSAGRTAGKPSKNMAQYIECEKARAAAQQQGRRGVAGRG